MCLSLIQIAHRLSSKLPIRMYFSHSGWEECRFSEEVPYSENWSRMKNHTKDFLFSTSHCILMSQYSMPIEPSRLLIPSFWRTSTFKSTTVFALYGYYGWHWISMPTFLVAPRYVWLLSRHVYLVSLRLQRYNHLPAEDSREQNERRPDTPLINHHHLIHSFSLLLDRLWQLFVSVDADFGSYHT